MAKHLACRYEELSATGMKAVQLERKAVVLVRAGDGSVHALRNVCPHKGPCLSDGMLDKGCSGASAGDYLYEADTELLRCPWHSWEFDIRTGKSLFDPERVKVRTYTVTVEEGNVYVEV